MYDDFGTFDEMLSRLLEMGCSGKVVILDKGRRGALFAYGGMQAMVSELAGGWLRMVYELVPNQPIEETISPSQAVSLIVALMKRECPPDGQKSTQS